MQDRLSQRKPPLREIVLAWAAVGALWAAFGLGLYSQWHGTEMPTNITRSAVRLQREDVTERGAGIRLQRSAIDPWLSVAHSASVATMRPRPPG